MATFNAGDMFTVNLGTDDRLTIDGAGSYACTLANGTTTTGTLTGRQYLGAFQQSATIVITATSGGSYSTSFQRDLTDHLEDHMGMAAAGTNLAAHALEHAGMGALQMSKGLVTPVKRTSSIAHSDIATLTTTTGGAVAGTLYAQTIMLPCGVDAVQVAPLTNNTAAAGYPGVLGYVQTSDASGSGSDLKNPYLAGAVQAMQQLTWGGANSPTFPTPANANIAVGPWSDWIPVNNTGSNSPSYLITRFWYPAGLAAGGGYNAVNSQGGRSAEMTALGAGSFYGYALSNVGASNSASLTSGNAALPVLVRFAAQKRVISIAQYGDSTRQGWYGNGVVAAVERYGISKSLAGTPVAVTNRGWSGQTSSQYLARLIADVAAGDRFDVLIWQVASPNDGFSAAISQQQIANAHAAIRIAESIGAHIILDGPYPVTASAPTGNHTLVVKNAKAFCLAMSGVRPGISAITYDALHQAGAYGQWVSAYNNGGDGLHQNELATTSVILPNVTAALNSILNSV